MVNGKYQGCIFHTYIIIGFKENKKQSVKEKIKWQNFVQNVVGL